MSKCVKYLFLSLKNPKEIGFEIQSDSHLYSKEKMKPRLNHQMRKQLKAERKLEAMVKYEIQSSDQIRSALISYANKYGDNFFIRGLTKDYERNLRSVGE